MAALDPGQPGPGDLDRIKARWRAEHERHAGVPRMILGDGFVAELAEPVARLAGQERAQLGGLINAVNSLQDGLASAGFADTGQLAARRERLTDPAAFLAQFGDPSLRAPIYGRRRDRRPGWWHWPAAAAVLAAVLFAPLWIALPLGAAAVLALCSYAIALHQGARPASSSPPRPPRGRRADLYPTAVTRAELYAAARARYLATGKQADLADMERHVGATPDDDGPAWSPPDV